MQRFLLVLCLTLLGSLALALPNSPAADEIRRIRQSEDRQRRTHEHEERVRGLIEEHRLARLAEESSGATTATVSLAVPLAVPPLPAKMLTLPESPVVLDGLKALAERVEFVPKPMSVDGKEVPLPAFVKDVHISGLPPVRPGIASAQAIVQIGDYRWVISTNEPTRMMAVEELDAIRREHLAEFANWGPPVTAIFQEAKVEQVFQVVANTANTPIRLAPALNGKRISVVQKEVALGKCLEAICLGQGWTWEISRGEVLVRPFPEEIDPWELLGRHCTLTGFRRDFAIIEGLADRPVGMAKGGRLPIPLGGGSSIFADVAAVRPERHEVELRLGGDVRWLVMFPDEFAEVPVTLIFQDAKFEKILATIQGSVPGLKLEAVGEARNKRCSIVWKDQALGEAVEMITRSTGLSYRWAAPDRLVFGTPEDLQKL